MESIEELRRALRLRGLQGLGGTLQHAAIERSDRDALIAVAHAYRNYARLYPELYDLTQRAVVEDDDTLKHADGEVVEVVLAVLAGYGLKDEDALLATRCLRSALHGFVMLETSAGFSMPLAIETSFDLL